MYLPSSRTTHMVLPWAWPSHGSYLSQGSPRGGVGTSRVGLPPTDTRTMALKPPFSSLHFRSEVPGPEASSSVSWPLVVSPPPRSFLPVVSGGDTVDASTWRRLILATPQPGDGSTWQRLNLATPQPGDALSGQPVDLPPLLTLTLTLVNDWGRDGTTFIT